MTMMSVPHWAQAKQKSSETRSDYGCIVCSWWWVVVRQVWSRFSCFLGGNTVLDLCHPAVSTGNIHWILNLLVKTRSQPCKQSLYRIDSHTRKEILIFWYDRQLGFHLGYPFVLLSRDAIRCRLDFVRRERETGVSRWMIKNNWKKGKEKTSFWNLIWKELK